MNLDNLKPAWQQLKVLNSMQALDREEILLTIERAEGLVINKTNQVLITDFMFIVVTLCCQAG
jgi:hypothetical protein